MTEQEWSIAQEAALLLQGNPSEPPKGHARTLLRDVLDEHRRKDALDDRSGSIRGTGCLTEAWISGDRFGWVDLQAGPFEWGPAYHGGGYKSATSEIIPHRPRPQLPPSQRTNLRLYAGRVEQVRGKIEERASVLHGLAVQMGCEQEGERHRNREGSGVTEVACDEIVSQRDFLRGFQTKEAELMAELEAAAAAVAADKETGEDGDAKATTDDLRMGHVKLLEAVVNAVAPATESDPVGAYGSSVLLGPETRELLTRLAALVASLARSVITPSSVLPLPRPPPDAFATAYAGGHALSTATTNPMDDAKLGGSPVRQKELRIGNGQVVSEEPPNCNET